MQVPRREDGVGEDEVDEGDVRPAIVGVRQRLLSFFARKSFRSYVAVQNQDAQAAVSRLHSLMAEQETRAAVLSGLFPVRETDHGQLPVFGY